MGELNLKHRILSKTSNSSLGLIYYKIELARGD
jgi:hypothetical protein